jgi:predicted ATPase
METIEIKNFLTIDHAVFEIKKINILIGSQAQGKSVIAKLVYFFKNFFSEIFLESIEKLETKRDIQKKCQEQFELIFPRYSWSNKEFVILYKNNNYTLSIVGKKSNSRYILKFDYCTELASFHKKLKDCYKNALEEFDSKIEEESRTRRTRKRERIFYDVILEKIKDYEFGSISKRPIFIPATRSFFANLQKNIFSFLASNIDIDPLIKDFGSFYENSKRLYRMEFNLGQESSELVRKKLDKFINDIIVGEYVYLEEQDWIQTKDTKVNLANASSGQQESLPMLLVLKVWSSTSKTTFFIEEPEAHLFPHSQKQIISLISTIYNAFGHSFFITTHSPYILTAINNLIAGKDAYNKAQDNQEQLKKLFEVFDKDELISLEDVSAYTLKKGKLESIIDQENRLIGAEILDSVSGEFEKAYRVAIDVLYGDE